MEFQTKQIESKIGYVFSNKEYLQNAFVHSSYANEHKVSSNERLEFLGDSVLSLVITDEIFHKMKKNEGDLSKIRASLVSEKSLSFIFSQLDLLSHLICGEGLKNSVPSQAMQADAMEAIIASVYLDSGMESARRFVLRLFEEPLKQIKRSGVPESHKSILQEKFKNAKIVYQVSSSGEGQDKFYVSKVFINGVMSGIGRSGKKREAEDLSAKEALERVKKA